MVSEKWFERGNLNSDKDLAFLVNVLNFFSDIIHSVVRLAFRMTFESYTLSRLSFSDHWRNWPCISYV